MAYELLVLLKFHTAFSIDPILLYIYPCTVLYTLYSTNYAICSTNYAICRQYFVKFSSLCNVFMFMYRLNIIFSIFVLIYICTECHLYHNMYCTQFSCINWFMYSTLVLIRCFIMLFMFCKSLV